MLFIYGVAAFVFFALWVRGAFWVGAFMAFCGFGLGIGATALSVVTSEKTTLIEAMTYGTMPIIWAIGALGLLPWFIRSTIERGRRVRQMELLHGVRFSARAGD